MTHCTFLCYADKNTADGRNGRVCHEEMKLSSLIYKYQLDLFYCFSTVNVSLPQCVVSLEDAQSENTSLLFAKDHINFLSKVCSNIWLHLLVNLEWNVHHPETGLMPLKTTSEKFRFSSTSSDVPPRFWGCQSNVSPSVGRLIGWPTRRSVSVSLVSLFSYSGSRAVLSPSHLQHKEETQILKKHFLTLCLIM